MKYSVGEIAHLLNITPSALRFYESEDIIHAEKSQSGRRYYSQGDLARLISCKKYSSMEIPIKTIAGQFKPGGDPRPAIAGRLWEKAAEIEEKARYYKQLSELVKEQAEHLERIDGCLDQFFISIREGSYILSDQNHQLMSLEEESKKLIRPWIQALPAVKISAIRRPAEGAGEAETALAYVISEKHADQMNLPVTGPGIEYLPSSACVHTVISLRDSFFQTERIFTAAIEYMQTKSITQNGVATAVLLVVESLEDGHYDGFLEIMVPFIL